jgi:molecular chaperone HscB
MMSGDYFSLLSQPREFSFDPGKLESAYFAAQRQYHPDRFVGKPAPERLAAVQKSADINKAYETLKNPLRRSQYLLHLQGITVGTEADSIKPSAVLLAETIEWRERIAEAQDAETLEMLKDELEKLMSRSLKILANNFLYAQWNEMAQETLRLGYIIKAQEALKARK